MAGTILSALAPLQHPPHFKTALITGTQDNFDLFLASRLRGPLWGGRVPHGSETAPFYAHGMAELGLKGRGSIRQEQKELRRGLTAVGLRT